MDWLVVVLVLSFAIRGWIRGLVSQLFAVTGLLVAVWVAGWVSQWVGEHWQHARPAVVFLPLRLLVMLLAGLAVVSLFHWMGTLAREVAREGPLGLFDGAAGLLVGAALGTVFVTLLMCTALDTPWPRAVPATAAHARLAAPMMKSAAEACGAVRPYSPGVAWLRETFLKAERRAIGAKRSA